MTEREMTVTASIENLNAVTAFVDEFLEAQDCPLKAQMQLDVALDELFSNIAYYAYTPGVGDVTVRVSGDGSSAALTLIDGGTPYNPLEHQDPDTTLSAEEREIGGLGLLMVKRTMDEMSYRYEDGKNILTVKKNFA